VTRRAAVTTNIPVVNAGDAPRQHPTKSIGAFSTKNSISKKYDGSVKSANMNAFSI
ncbi:hypothetical protein Tco_0515389, partial [Tanacetum coccineum]